MLPGSTFNDRTSGSQSNHGTAVLNNGRENDYVEPPRFSLRTGGRRYHGWSSTRKWKSAAHITTGETDLWKLVRVSASCHGRGGGLESRVSQLHVRTVGAQNQRNCRDGNGISGADGNRPLLSLLLPYEDFSRMEIGMRRPDRSRSFSSRQVRHQVFYWRRLLRRVG